MADPPTATNTKERDKMRLVCAIIYLTATLVIPNVLFISIGWSIYIIIERIMT